MDPSGGGAPPGGPSGAELETAPVQGGSGNHMLQRKINETGQVPKEG
jgi:hypothetical protein